MDFKKFQSKILLFGEYSVIYNSRALLIPYSIFSGKLAFPDEDTEKENFTSSNEKLQLFF